jgi:hypothetical protein
LSSGTTIYTIEADLVKEHNHSLETSMLFLITTCVAVVDYCLLNRREQTNPETQSLQLDLESSEYLEICFRLRRCGAAKVTPGLISREEDCQIALEERLNSSPYLFGWPTVDGLAEPVWVYTISRTDSFMPFGIVRFGGIEAHLGLEALAQCTTMSEYCDMLKLRGAIYYDKVKKSLEAQELALVSRPGYLEDV